MSADLKDSARLVSLEFRGAVAELALDNGPINLVTRDLLRALNNAVTELVSHTELRCVIVHGGAARASGARMPCNSVSCAAENPVPARPA